MLKSRLSRLLAAALAGLILAAVPAAANAQQLTSVAIRTSVSGGFLVLDVANASTSAGAPVIQWYGNGGSNQLWNFVPTADGNEQIVNLRSGMCLTTNGIAGQTLYQWPCTGSLRQEWSSDLQEVFHAGYISSRAILNVGTGLTVDVNGGSALAGAGAIAWYPNGGANQGFSYWQL